MRISGAVSDTLQKSGDSSRGDSASDRETGRIIQEKISRQSGAVLSAAPNAAGQESQSAAEMFLFLTKGTPKSLKSLRRATAEQLKYGKDFDPKDRDSDYYAAHYWTGLFMAAVMLPPEAFQLVAAKASRWGLRSMADQVIFGELAAMQAQRGYPLSLPQLDTVEERFKDKLSSFISKISPLSATFNRHAQYGAAHYAELDFYSRNSLKIHPGPDPDSAKIYQNVERLHKTFSRRVVLYKIGVGLTGLLTLAALYSVVVYTGVKVTGFATAGVWTASLIAFAFLKGGLAAAYDNWRNSLSLAEKFLFERLGRSHQLSIARRWLNLMSGGDYSRNSVPFGQAAKLILSVQDQIPLPEREALFRNWNRQSDLSPLSLGYLHDLVPPGQRQAMTEIILAPLRKPMRNENHSYLFDYDNALAAWIGKANLSPAETGEIFARFSAVLTSAIPALNLNWKQQYPFATLEALAGRPDLPTEVRDQLRLYVHMLLDSHQGAGFDMGFQPRLAIILARMGEGTRAWEALRKRAGPRWAIDSFLPEIYELIKIAPPSPEDAAWLESFIQMLGEDIHSSRGHTVDEYSASPAWFYFDIWRPLILKSIRKAPAGENLLSFLKTLHVWSRVAWSNWRVREPLLREIRISIEQIMAEQEKKRPGYLNSVVQENLQRLAK